MSNRRKITIATLHARKREHQKITMLTCYDYTVARLIEEAGIDSILVGDTYGEVVLGYDSTLPVKLDHMVTLAAAVRRGAPSVFLIGDMPFLSYQISEEEAIRNAGKFMADAGCDCVKVEVDRRLVGRVEAMASASIPVMAHLGLKPQSVHTIGGYKVQGRSACDAKRILEDAKMMEDAGAIALLVEAVPVELGGIIAESTQLPVIGCVCGTGCDGQVVVLHDILGFGAGHPPKSVKVYADLNEQLMTAFRAYAADVQDCQFPVPERSVSMSAPELEKLRKLLR